MVGLDWLAISYPLRQCYAASLLFLSFSSMPCSNSKQLRVTLAKSTQLSSIQGNFRNISRTISLESWSPGPGPYQGLISFVISTVLFIVFVMILYQNVELGRPAISARSCYNLASWIVFQSFHFRYSANFKKT